MTDRNTDSPRPVIPTDILRTQLFGLTSQQSTKSTQTPPVEPSANPQTLVQPPTPTGSLLLTRFSITGASEKLANQLTKQIFVLDCLALKGQSTVIFAAPNTGKTALAFNLVASQLQKTPELAGEFYIVNADDNATGVVDKTIIAEEPGINILVPGHLGFETKRLIPMMDTICQKGDAPRVIIIVDTLKKVVDVMRKSNLREFGDSVRRFVSMGGTFIALAHTNKRKAANGESIPEGAGDILNDCDCAYVIEEVERDENSKTVKFRNIKSRGGAAQELYFRYSVEDNLNYSELLASIERIPEHDIDQFRKAPEDKTESLIIRAIIDSIDTGHDTKMRIRDFAASISGASKRQVLAVLEKYTGSEPNSHKWNFTRGERGKLTYSVLSDFQNSRSTEEAAE